MDKETVRKVARIARLDLTEEELEEFSSDLEEILASFASLDEPEVSEQHRFNPVDNRDKLREDSACREIDSAVLRELMRTHDDWVRGPRLS
jgi:aspartyl-tRNA(Asn)/glutamyl-tRNA(Gln) amidotransferase subunit C